MKFIKTLLVSFVLLFSIGMGNAQAADDADCVGSSQSAMLNLSDGAGVLCISANYANGNPIPAIKVLTCTVTFKDGSGAELSTQAFTGPPGSAHDVVAPQDGVGTSEAFCTVDTLTSTVSTTPTTFPSSVAPAQPVLIE
jgi:hypothetical protein